MPEGYDDNKISGYFPEGKVFTQDLLKNHRALLNEFYEKDIGRFYEIFTFDKTALSKFIRENPEKIKGTPLADIAFTEETESLVIGDL